MTRPEPWELSDDQLWREINHAALIEAFRRSEISEKREARQAWEAAHPEWAARQFVEAMAKVVACMQANWDEMRLHMTWECARPTPVATATRPLSAGHTRRPDHLAPVPTLRAALATNARPRPGPHQRQRTPHVQRR